MLAGSNGRLCAMLMLGMLASCSGSDGVTRAPDSGENGADGGISVTEPDAAPTSTAGLDADVADAAPSVTAPIEAGSTAPPAPDAAPPVATDASVVTPEPDAAATTEPVDETSDPPVIEDSGAIPVGPGPTEDPTVTPTSDAATDEPPPERVDAGPDPEVDAGPLPEPPMSCAGCTIGDTCFIEGDVNPSNSCVYCNVATSTTQWSPRPNGTRCSDGLFCNGADSCHNGTCSTHVGRTCDDGIDCNGAESCSEEANRCQRGPAECEQGEFCDAETDSCVETCNGCVIDGTCYANGEGTAQDLCLVCDVATSTSDWSSHQGEVCGGGGEQPQCVHCGCPEGLAGPNCDQCVVFVDLDESDANTGTSWEEAVASVQVGIELAAGYAENQDLEECQVWVRAGVYHPTLEEEDPRDASFQLRSRVALYGGFAGDEMALEDRNVLSNSTVLSGDLADNDDSGGGEEGPSEANFDDNSYHVVIGASNAVIDGFTIMGGIADGGIESSTGVGGGVYLDGTSPTIRNCRITGNLASAGGGLFAFQSGALISDTMFAGNGAFDADLLNGAGGGAYSEDGALEFTGVTFVNNVTLGYGAGLYADDFVTVRNSRFQENFAPEFEFSTYGGAAFVTNSAVFSATVFESNAASFGGAVATVSADAGFVNCTFEANEAELGGAAYHGTDGENEGAPQFVHGTFVDNQAESGSVLFVERGASGPDLGNCIVWNNGATPIDGNSGDVSVSYTLITGDWPGPGNFDCDPLFMDEAVGDFRLKPGSPAIDASNPVALIDIYDVDGDGDQSETLPLDQSAAPRIFDGDVAPPAIADMGALEATSSQAPSEFSGSIDEVRYDLPGTFCAEGGSTYAISYSHSGGENDRVTFTTEVIAPETVVSGASANLVTTGSNSGTEDVPTGHVSGYADPLRGRRFTTRVTLSHCGDVLDEVHIVNSCDESGQQLVETVVGGSEPFEPDEEGTDENGWRWINNDEMVCASGDTTGFGLNLVEGSRELVVFLDAGGACFDATSCALAGVATSFDDEAFDDRKALLNMMGVFNRADAENPFAGMSWAFVPYCTGDVHAGNHASTENSPLNFLGHQNIEVVIEALRRNYPTLDRLVFAGASAGGFGTLFNFDVAAGSFGEADATLLDDSGPVLGDALMTPRESWFGLWEVGPSVPVQCDEVGLGDAGSLDAIYGCLADLYPSSRFGLITTDADLTNRAFLGFPGLMPQATYTGGINALVSSLAGESQWATYLQAGSTAHVLSLNPLSEQWVPAGETPGTTLADFMHGVVYGDGFGSAP